MKQDFKILLVEDDESFRQAVHQLLGVYNDVEGVGDIAAARKALQSNSYEVVILDKRLPDGDGLTLVPEIKAENPNTVVLILTADSDFSSVKKCIATGADDYVVKSDNIIPDLLVRIPIAVSRAADARRLSSLDEQVKQAFKYELVGKSLANSELRASILALKGHPAHVLITGENGTGKELVARRIHAIDEGDNRPLVVVNCGAIPENLVESELFGHKRGAFTSADQDKAGKFELAHGGTLFLDEIGELPVPAQAKLLRAVEDGQFFRVGGTKPVNVSCRIVAATNRNLEEMVKKKAFREDLYYRLNVVRIKTTPLRARLEDVPDLARFFVFQIGGTKTSISEAAIKRLVSYSWPGNIRELRNTIERAIISARRRGSVDLDAQDISVDGAFDALGLAQKRLDSALPNDVSHLTEEQFNSFMEIAEREFLRLGLDLVDGNAAELAARIGMGRSTVFKKVSLFGLGKRLAGEPEQKELGPDFARLPSPGGLQ